MVDLMSFKNLNILKISLRIFYFFFIVGFSLCIPFEGESSDIAPKLINTSSSFEAFNTHDICDNAISVSCGESITESTLGSSSDSQINSCLESAANSGDYGVWHTIIGTGKVIKAKLCDSDIYPYITVFQGTCSNLVCIENLGRCRGGFGNGEVNFLAENGTEYYILVYANQEGNYTLEIECEDPPSNDLCVDAIPLTCGQTIAGDNIYATKDNIKHCVETHNSRDYNGVWYTLVGNGQPHYIDICDATINLGIAIFEGDCSNLICNKGTSRGCSPYGAMIGFPTLSGVTYFINVHGPEGYGSFNLTVDCGNPPVTATCDAAIPIACGDVLTGTPEFAYVNNQEDCGDQQLDGVWYKIIGEDRIINVNIPKTNDFDISFEITAFGNQCGNLVCIDSETNNAGRLSFFGNIGEEYKILIGSKARAPFTIEIRCGTQATNDFCSGAIPIFCNDPIIVDSTTWATDDDTNCHDLDNGRWYKFTGTGQALSITTCGFGVAAVLQVFRGNCSGYTCMGLGSQYYKCGSALDRTFNFTSVSGTEYLILVQGKIGSFSLELECAPLGEISNDQITRSVPILCGQSIIASNKYAKQHNSFPSPCIDDRNAVWTDSWFKFIGNGQQVSVNNCGSGFWGQISVFSGSIGNLSCEAFGDGRFEENRIACNQGHTRPNANFFAEEGTAYYILMRVHPGYGKLEEFQVNIDAEQCNCEANPDIVELNLPPSINTFKTHSHIETNMSSSGNLDHTLLAGESITLLPEFCANQGSQFSALIQECEILTCMDTDSMALVALYNATNGANWTNTWNLSQPVATWFGIETNSEGCVRVVDLSDNNLIGTIPAELGNLLSVEEISLKSNQLSGSIPPELGNLLNLEYIHLATNELTGSIPPELGSLVNLEYFHLAWNDLTGSIPPELGNLVNLTDLFLYNNPLTGSIPPELGNLINLNNFFLYNCQFTGNIPPELGNLLNVNYFWIFNNQLTGNIPPELGNLTPSNIRLDVNQLSGCFPQELMSLCTASNKDFSNNPALPGGGNFDAFCSNGTGGCTTLTDNLEVTSFKAANSSNQLNKTVDLQLSIVPNPVKQEALINFYLPNPTELRLVLYNLQGMEIAILQEKQLEEIGKHQIRLSATNYPSGIYYVHLETDSLVAIKKLVVID